METVFDLHSHTHYSDGKLSPEELILLAKEVGVTSLALTDHDTVAGVEEAAFSAKKHGIELIPGVEISANWHGHTLHILGLAIDPACELLKSGLMENQAKRQIRAQNIAKQLEREGISKVSEVLSHLSPKTAISRSHFAAFLVEKSYVKDYKQAFKRYLGRGKPAYVKVAWPDLKTVLSWIHEAGGDAVIAHPTRYNFTRTKIGQLTSDFKQLGGDALEVVTSSTQTDEIQWLTHLCREYQLYSSVGSDFHGPNTWPKLGNLRPLPSACQPIWSKWSNKI